MKRRYAGLFITLGVLFLVAVIGILLNATFLSRSLSFFTQDQVRRVDWFKPTVGLTAADTPVPALISSTPNSASATFATPIAFARETNTSALLVWHKGQLALEYYAGGYEASDLTQTNSVHKSILALLVGIAVDEGAIGSVDDPVEDYLEDWIQQPLGKVRIKHLLSMTSGLGAPSARIRLFDHSMRLLHAPDIAQVARAAEQTQAPGELFDYSNTNAQLLVEVLESATNENYEDYLSRKLWSVFAEYPGALWPDREAGTPHGFCCLIATPRDLLRLGLILLNDGRVGAQQVVSQAWIKAMAQPSVRNPNYGYLVWRGSPYQPVRGYSAKGQFGAQHSEPYLADDLLFFDGFGGQRIYIVPSLELVIVRVGETRFDFDDALLPNQVIESISNSAAAVPSASSRSAFVDLNIDVDHAQNLDLRVAYPVGATGSTPLVVFSHGNGLANTNYDALLEDWVEAGFVVVAPRHLDVGSRAELDALTQRVGRDWVAVSRVLDMRAVIDQAAIITAQLPGYVGAMDSSRVIAAGHSFGAYSAQLLGGARYERQGDSSRELPQVLGDSRVKAVVGLSSPGVLPDVLTQAAWRGFQTPQLVITGTKDTFEFLWPDYREHFVAYEVAEPGHNYLLVIEEMDHYMGNLLGRLDRGVPAQHTALASVGAATIRFMQSYLTHGATPSAIDAMARSRSELSTSNVVRFEQR